MCTSVSLNVAFIIANSEGYSGKKYLGGGGGGGGKKANDIFFYRWLVWTFFKSYGSLVFEKI